MRQNCKENVQTQVDYEVGGLTWLIAGVLCIFGYLYGYIRYIYVFANAIGQHKGSSKTSLQMNLKWSDNEITKAHDHVIGVNDPFTATINNRES